MGPMSSTEQPTNQYSPAERHTMLGLARESIIHGLNTGAPLRVTPDDYPVALRAERACFVTLTKSGRLRGCIGHLEPVQTLIEDVAENAWSAAFRDPRFPSLQVAELDEIRIEISVLGEPGPIGFSSEEDLVAQIRPGIDGLILQAPTGHRGTFLPSVWESLPERREFLAHLKLKAGLPMDYWDDGVKIWRYTTEAFEEA